MCVNQRFVWNKYIGRSIYVKCGHCEACLQEKAAMRANRIRNAVTKGFVPYFVTLTYDNYFVPYVYRQDLNLKQIPVYRDYEFHVVGVEQGNFERRVVLNKEPLFYIDNSSEIDYRFAHYNHLRGGDVNKIGVCYYPDVQKFIKKVRSLYYKTYGERLFFFYFACSEYGGTYQRPHFHLLVFVPESLGEWFRGAVSSCWSYGNRVPSGRYVEVARDAAGYVASYVNSVGSIFPFFAIQSIKQKHSYSKGFGCSSDVFSLSSILKKIDLGDLSYTKETIKEGKSVLEDFFIPSYIINRFFPRFKGYSRIIPDELCDYLSNPHRLYEYRSSLDYSDDDLHKIQVRLNNCIDYFCFVTGLTKFDYARCHVAVWRCYSSNLLKRSLLSVSNWYEYYVNILDYTCGYVSSNLTSVASIKSRFVINPNEFVENVSKTESLTQLYYKMSKQKLVTNSVMNSYGIFV